VRDNDFFKRPTIPPLPPAGKSEEKPAPIPEWIGPYHVDSLLDKGGMSLLYLASHPETKAPITIKVLSPKFLSHPEMTSRFLKEAEIIAMADHPNIIKLYGYGEWEGGLYIAMEFIRGVSLRQYFLQNPLSLRRALEMVLEIAYALCHLHTHGVIHRDLKPENILIDESQHIKVIDFGIAQLIDPLSLEKGPEDGTSRRLVGTPVYMSPEQRQSPETVSYPSDIYSLGIIAYELVLGKLSQGQVYLSLMPRGLQKILAKMLQLRPQDRYQDIVDFISDLSSYLHSPQFEKEKKIGDQAGELFEKIQDLQSKLIPAELEMRDSKDFGLVIHKPLSFSAIYADLRQSQSLLLMGESSSLDIEGMIQMVYFKGALDTLLSQQMDLASTAKALNGILLQAPISLPLSFGALQWDLHQGKARFLSCGFGPLWKISVSPLTIESTGSPNLALSLTADADLKIQELLLQKGDRLILCPLSSTGIPFTAEQFKQLLFDLNSLAPQPLAEAVYRKAMSLNSRHFDEHPFVIAVLQF
jgi:serine/threonine protein kinase